MLELRMQFKVKKYYMISAQLDHLSINTMIISMNFDDLSRKLDR